MKVWRTEKSIEMTATPEAVWRAWADVAGTVIRTTHRVDDIGGGRAVVVYALEASGPAAEDLGPAISADFDDTLRALRHYIASGVPVEPPQSESSA